VLLLSLLNSQTLHKLFAYGLELDNVSVSEYHASEEIVDNCPFSLVVAQTDIHVLGIRLLAR